MISGIGVYLITRYHPVPNAYLPWKVLAFDDELTFLTEFKIGQLKGDNDLCLSVFKDSDVRYDNLPDRQAGNCKLEDQINVKQSQIMYSAALRGQCALMSAIMVWEREVVQRLAQKYFGTNVTRIKHYGIFACRNVAGAKRRKSQHATANAIDIAGFTLKNGRYISVLNDWGKDTDKALFLSELRDKSCGVFHGVLGPDYNNLHKDHFHFDLGPYQICR